MPNDATLAAQLAACKAMLANVTAERDAAQAEVERSHGPHFVPGIQAMARVNARFLAERDAAREALRPFAEMADVGLVEYASRLHGAGAARSLYRYLVGVDHVHTASGIVYASEILKLIEAALAALGGSHE